MTQAEYDNFQTGLDSARSPGEVGAVILRAQATEEDDRRAAFLEQAGMLLSAMKAAGVQEVA